MPLSKPKILAESQNKVKCGKIASFFKSKKEKPIIPIDIPIIEGHTVSLIVGG